MHLNGRAPKYDRREKARSANEYEADLCSRDGEPAAGYPSNARCFSTPEKGVDGVGDARCSREVCGGAVATVRKRSVTHPLTLTHDRITSVIETARGAGAEAQRVGAQHGE
jgi:hypothetical protein